MRPPRDPGSLEVTSLRRGGHNIQKCHRVFTKTGNLNQMLNLNDHPDPDSAWLSISTSIKTFLKSFSPQKQPRGPSSHSFPHSGSQVQTFTVVDEDTEEAEHEQDTLSDDMDTL